MARHYSTKDFFRNMPNALLARYFQNRRQLHDFDFGSQKEAQPDALFTVWLSLPGDERKIMEAELREIFDMSCEKGFKAILDEAGWQFPIAEEFSAFVDRLSSYASHYERAMRTYLDHPELWRVAILFYHADTLSYWRKRKNLACEGAAVDPVSLLKLADQISSYFHTTEGRGRQCVVEPYRRGELDYYFAYPEDYSQQAVEWVDGQFERRPHNPAFEVVFVYSQKEGSLDLNFRGSHKAVEPLQAMFAETILKLPEMPPDPKDTRVYDLNQLGQKSFDFNYAIDSGIKHIAITKLRLSSKSAKGERITLEAGSGDDPNAIYALLDKLAGAVSLQHYNVTQVELKASVVQDVSKSPKVVTVRISHPNSCSLKYDEIDLKLRAMLELSGIEPKEVSDLTAGGSTSGTAEV